MIFDSNLNISEQELKELGIKKIYVEDVYPGGAWTVFKFDEDKYDNLVCPFV